MVDAFVTSNHARAFSRRRVDDVESVLAVYNRRVFFLFYFIFIYVDISKFARQSYSVFPICLTGFDYASLVGTRHILMAKLKALEEDKDKEVNNFSKNNIVLKRFLDTAEAQKKDNESRISEQEREIDNLRSSLAHDLIECIRSIKGSY